MKKTTDDAKNVLNALNGSYLPNATQAPVVYFEAVTNQGGVGVVNVTLATFLYLVDKEGGVGSVPSVVAHLRCPRDAAIMLRDSLNRAIANGEPPPPEASMN